MTQRYGKVIINRLHDEKSLKIIFDTHFDSVYRRIVAMINNPLEAEEITQDIFVAIWNRREKLKEIENWEAYLIKAATFKSIDHIRKKRNSPKLSSDAAFLNMAADETDHVEEDALLEKLKDQIDLLPERCQIAFKLSRYEQLSYADIAKTLDISPKTVENQIGKALKILRKNLLPQLFFGLLQFFQ
jgi:RNA polymerase sigma-70 factor (ECF subfamily)